MRTFRTAIPIAITSIACDRSASRDHTPPSAAFVAYPTTGPAPLRVRFDSTSSPDDVGVVSFRWEFGDGYTARGAVVDHTFPSRGAFLAALIASDAAGNQGRAEKVIEVTAPDDAVPPRASFATDVTSGVAPLPVHFDASASSDDVGITAYAWDFADGAAGEGSATAASSTGASGTSRSPPRG